MRFPIVLILFVLLSTSCFADITLVSEGKSQTVIVVPEGLSKQVALPATPPLPAHCAVLCGA